MTDKKTPETQEFKVPIQQLPYMGEKKEARIPPPVQRSKENADVRMRDDYKKGGSVKGWGIARGARKAKMY